MHVCVHACGGGEDEAVRTQAGCAYGHVRVCLTLRTACKTAFDFPTARTREKKCLLKFIWSLLSLRGHVLCAALWDILLKSQRRRRYLCGVLMGPCRISPGCCRHVPSCHSDQCLRGMCSFSPFVIHFIGIALAPVAACLNVL